MERGVAEEEIRKLITRPKKFPLRNEAAEEGNDVGNLPAALIGGCLYTRSYDKD